MSAEKLQGATATQSAFALPALCLFVCAGRKSRSRSLWERERDDGSAPGNKHRGDDLWERETMVWQLEMSVGVTIMWERERERMVWHLEISIEVTILWERETMFWHLEISIEVTMCVCERETMAWHLEMSIEVTIWERERDDDGLIPQNKIIYWHVIIDDGTSIWYSQHTRGDVGIFISSLCSSMLSCFSSLLLRLFSWEHRWKAYLQ